MGAAAFPTRTVGDATLTASSDARPNAIARTDDFAIDGDVIAGVAILAAALVIGLATASHYGATVDEFNADDYGPKALAWYTSGFADRSHFEDVESPLWYYGPWFQMLIAFVQSLGLADALTVRHALTFLVGLAGLAALLPIARLSVGRWAGPAALVLCLTTGYLYGSLFFTPIDVPFLAAMCWAMLAILLMARQVVPGWPATIGAGLATGLAIATRTGGIITHGYLIGAMVLGAVEALALHGRAASPQLGAILVRTAAAIAIAWMIAIVLWPWLQIGNPFTQFNIALVHFGKVPLDMEFPHWGEELRTTALPWSYIPEQWFARLPVGFLGLLLLATLFGCGMALWFARASLLRLRRAGAGGLRRPLLLLARSRRIILVWMAVIAPVGFVMIQHTTLYDGVRHTLFVIPMLALLAGWALMRLAPYVRGVRVPVAALAGAYVIALAIDLATLHPLEYVAMNSLAGGTAGAYGRFELDYWGAAATEALRALERRLDAVGAFAQDSPGPPSLLICIPYREHMVEPMLHKRWRIELDPGQADFVIATQRSNCVADAGGLTLIDEVKRHGRAFARIYVNKDNRFIDAARP
jgi:hypothetical protein